MPLSAERTIQSHTPMGMSEQLEIARSAIDHVDYDQSARRLSIRFKDGRRYTWFDVAPEIHAQLNAVAGPKSLRRSGGSALSNLGIP